MSCGCSKPSKPCGSSHTYAKKSCARKVKVQPCGCNYKKVVEKVKYVPQSCGVIKNGCGCSTTCAGCGNATVEILEN